MARAPVAACQGDQLVVHFINRKNAPLDFHTTGDATGAIDSDRNRD